MLKLISRYLPQWPLAIVLAGVGLLNMLEGLQVSVSLVSHVQALSDLAAALPGLGGTAQVILGLMLLFAGIGLIWRIVSAWTLSVLLLLIMIGVNVVLRKWGVNLALQVLLIGVLWWTRHHFTRRTILASFIFSLSGIVAILAYGTIGSYLLGNGFRPQIHDWNTSFYYTVVSLSTVGYGDIVPVTVETRWFSVSLLVVGLGVFASVIASVIGPKISGELQRIFNPRGKVMEHEDHVILIGEGAIAQNTAAELKRRGQTYVQVVASSTDALDETNHVVVGQATDDDVLRRAGIEDARLVIAAGEDDGENAMIALVAKDLNPDIRLLAVASSSSAVRRLKLAGVDLVFSPAEVGGRLLADLVEGNEISLAFQDLLNGELHEG